MYWSGRARHPVALHAAIQMDKNHPQYRRTAQSVDQELDIDKDN